MPSSDSADHRRTTTKHHHHLGVAPPPEPPEHLPCPRCDSTNTKFCYYNNYNFSQPRHFCKACRRYWTHGGTLRDIPVGAAAGRTPNAPIVPATAVPVFAFAGDHGGAPPSCGSFTSLLSNNNTQSNGFFGLGVGGFDQDLSFGLGRTIWPFSDGGHSAGGGGGGGGSGNTWQLESGEGGGDCFVLPDLAIATRGSGLK
ncbi:hypothetical protein OSB04_000058 [Centaurea solstitialis]|uniref:Dof-type domain-containing protein n=1 Tax=Centaurea solstitialis TaxID=347529 RepID=A0AA38WK67_9ASTR|nr:hypothetical protein OSB04_000058 [Centaurea solstitialis]